MLKRPLLFFLFLLLSICILVQIDNNRNTKEIIQEETKGKVVGIIEQIIEKEKTTSIYLKQVHFYVTDETGKEAVFYSCDKVLVYISKANQLKIGNQVAVSGTIDLFQKPSNIGQFNERAYYKADHVVYKMFGETVKVLDAHEHRVYNWLKEIQMYFQTIFSNIFSEKDFGIINAMLLGEKQTLDAQVKALYQKNGIAHILAISGLHISMIGLCLFHFLRKMGTPVPVAVFSSILFIWAYGIMTHFSVSTNRAVVMLSVMLFGQVIGRSYDMISATALSAIFILIQKPLQLFESGFLLSFGAIIGIAYLYPVFEDALFEKKEKKKAKKTISNKEKSFILHMKALYAECLSIIKKLKQSFFLSLSINIITLPIILTFYYEFPLYGIALNLVVIPLVSIVIMLSLISALIGCVYLKVAVFLAGGVHYILQFYEVMCQLFGLFPYSNIIVGKPESWQIVFYYAIIIITIFIYKICKKRRSLILLIGLLVIFYRSPLTGFQVTFLDVGQGDGIFMESESGNTYFIDGGSSDISDVGTYRLEPILTAKGVGTIDYAIITHADEDHISGLIELLEKQQQAGSICIKKLVLPYISCKEEHYISLEEIARRKHIEIVYIKKGDVIRDGNLEITCLHPVPNFQTASANAYSTVLSIVYKKFDMLLTGDLEGEGENLVQKIETLLEYDVLKVAHHGSKHSTSKEFLQIIKPKNSIISCGKRNRYGHPHKELLERLEEVGSEIYSTAESGAITIWTNGEKICIKSSEKENICK